MMSRAFLVAAAVALAAAEEDFLPCGPCGDCCLATSSYSANNDEHQCVDSNLNVCNLCSTGSGPACTSSQIRKLADHVSASMSGTSAQTSTGSVLTNTYRVRNGMHAFPDLKWAEFTGFPEYMVTGPRTSAGIGSWYIEPTLVSFQCDVADFNNAEGCDLFVFLYRCLPCEAPDTKSTSEILLSLDWTFNRCGPKLELSHGNSSIQHPYVFFHREMEASLDDLYQFNVPTQSKFFFTANKPRAKICSKQDEESKCTAVEGCEWENAACHRRHLCPPPPVGPFNGKCNVCAADEVLDLYPSLK